MRHYPGCGPTRASDPGCATRPVIFNDMPAARVGDPVDCGGEMKTGSADVFIGD